jgi:hypothetical protein
MRPVFDSRMMHKFFFLINFYIFVLPSVDLDLVFFFFYPSSMDSGVGSTVREITIQKKSYQYGTFPFEVTSLISYPSYAVPLDNPSKKKQKCKIIEVMPV